MSKSNSDERGRTAREVYGSSPIRLARDAAIIALFAGGVATVHGCVSDPDCGICDPDKLILETISGVNYAGKTIDFLGPRCKNDDGQDGACPVGEDALVEGEVYVENIGICNESDDALEAERGPGEWCRISPMIVDSNIAFVFNNLLEATSIELVRKQMTNPSLYEVYDWKHRILEIKGPITRYNGDYKNGVGENPDIMQRAVNLTCIENVSTYLGQPFDHNSLTDETCDTTFDLNVGNARQAANDNIRAAEGGGTKRTFTQDDEKQFTNSHPGGRIPLRMQPFGHTTSYAGESDIRSNANSCTTPDSGPDTCCSACDFELSVNIDKYGVDGGGAPLTPNAGTAFTCTYIDGMTNETVFEDKYDVCSGFIPSTRRGAEPRDYYFDWDCDGTADGPFKMPLVDMLRETHPNQRPACHEQRTVPCDADADCTSSNGAGLAGMACVGELHNMGGNKVTSGDNISGFGDACDPTSTSAVLDGGTCERGRCVAEWIADCVIYDKYNGEQGYCADRRFSDQGANSCFEFGGRELARYDADEDGTVSRAEANDAGICDPSAAACDPYVVNTGKSFRPNNYTRATSLPLEAQCTCVLDESSGESRPPYICRGIVARLCTNNGTGIHPDDEGKDNPTDQRGYNEDRDQEVIDAKLAEVALCEDARAECCELVNCSELPFVYTKETDYEGEDCDAQLTECLEASNLTPGRYPNISTMVKAEDFEAIYDVKPSRKGQYAQRFLSKFGGVVYDPAVKGVQYRIADRGSVQRAFLERCASGRPLSDTSKLGGVSIKDGWRANDNFAETYEDFDRGMCSSSSYTVRFSVPGDRGNPDKVQFVKDKVGNDLTDKNNYTFETPLFGIIPQSGFPSDNLRIGACDEFEIRFSNKYDMSANNLKKVQLVRLNESGDGYVEGNVVAGGLGCAETNDELDGTNVPCLTVNVKNQVNGTISVYVDYNIFNEVVLKPDRRYRFRVPGLETYSDGSTIKWPIDLSKVSDEDYKNAFWDICGMPLVLGKGRTDWQYDFTVDRPKCKEDKDGDGIPFSCDNAPDTTNQDQKDSDKDGFGDAEDLCVVTPQDTNSADSDRDGVGNSCDNCKERPSNVYNKGAMDAGVPDYMWVRNVPFQGDFDQDGIGDVCDNCVKEANCFDYGPNKPYTVGTPLDTDDKAACQKVPAMPANETWAFIGDACFEGGQPVYDMDVAAGPVGFGNDDDFDQDGLANSADFCPRQPLALDDTITCSDNEACGPSRVCTGGICNHIDSDGDNVGDACDTCSLVPNPMQTMDGGMQDDDEDEDFVGRMCETNSACADRADPRPYATYDVSVNGLCCTVAFDPARGLKDPDGRLLTLDCPDNDSTCRKLPDALANQAGVLELPPGCDQALVDAGYADGEYATLLNLNSPEIGGDEVLLWSYLCLLPQRDQDFDSVGDVCDKCPFAFDPNNEPYIDANGKLWPELGAYCNGEYDIEKVCEMTEGGDTDTEGETDTGGGETDTGTGG